MAHVEHKDGKITIHYGRNLTYGPVSNTTQNLYLSRWIVRLLKRVDRLKGQTSA